MEDEGEEVKVFLTRDGLVALVSGVRGDEATTKISGILTSELVEYTSRNTDYYAIDMVNNAGEEISYDMKSADVDVEGTTKDASLASEGAVIELEVDEDGDVEVIKVLASEGVVPDDVELDDKYIGANRLKATTVVYFLDGEGHAVSDIDADDVIVTTWADVTEFEELSKAVVYAKDGYVNYLVVEEDNTDSTSETDDLTALITDVRYNTDKELVRLTAFVNGAKETYTVNEVVYAQDKAGKDIETLKDIAADDVVVLKVDEDGIVQSIVKNSDLTVKTDVQLASIVTRDNEITVTGGTEYELVSDGAVYDITGTTKVINFRDLNGTTVTGDVYDKVTVVIDNVNSTRLVKMIIVTGEGTN